MPKQRAPEIPVHFYRTDAGRQPALEWLRSLNREDRHTVGLDLMRVQFGWPVGMPLMRSLMGGLWEVRSTLPSQRVARLILCFHKNKIVVLHGFIKKTRKTPQKDLDLAKQRRDQVMK